MFCFIKQQFGEMQNGTFIDCKKYIELWIYWTTCFFSVDVTSIFLLTLYIGILNFLRDSLILIDIFLLILYDLFLVYIFYFTSNIEIIHSST